MIVMKFGGTSVGNADAISQVASVVRHCLPRKPVVVVSAITKITDALIRLAEESSKGAGSDTLQLIRSVHEHTSESSWHRSTYLRTGPARTRTVDE